MKSQLSGEHAPVASEVLHQCHGGFLPLNSKYFKSSALVALQMSLAGGYYEVLPLQCMTCFTALSKDKICVAFGLSNDSIID